MERCRTPMTVDRYLAIQGKIISRAEGEARKYLHENYVIQDGQFVSKKRLDDMLASKKAPVGVISKEPSEDQEAYRNYMSTNLGFIQEVTSTLNGEGEYAPTRFNPIQGYLMNSTAAFLWAVKSRQFGFSFVIAAQSLAKAMLKRKHTSIFVSYNEEESKEKIVYARELYESMPRKWKLARKLKYDNKNSLVFEKSGQNSTETRILSYPQRIIRGKGGELDIRLDEAAHCIHIRKIYTSAGPALSRASNSTLWMGSSPAGKGGLFYEVGINQDNDYGPFSRVNIPWWTVPEFCTDVETAYKHAWDMHTDERVAAFASERLRLLRKTSTIDEFQQEFECEYLDEHYSYFPWDLINGCVPIVQIADEELTEHSAPGDELKEVDTARAGVGIDHYKDFEQFMFAVNSGMIEGPFLGGFDVGRTNDASEISYVSENPDTRQQILRCNIELKGVPFREQKAIVLDQFERLGRRLVKFGVDNNGIGMNIAEDLEALSYDCVVKLNFNNNAWKEEACRRFKFRMEQKDAIVFPTDRRILNQIHAIKRTLLPSGAWRFDVEANEKHHGDKFWSVLAASEVGFPPVGQSNETTSFDQRLALYKNQSGPVKRVLPSIIMTPARAQASMRYSPWQQGPAMGMGLPPLPGLPSPGSNILQGMTMFDKDLTMMR